MNKTELINNINNILYAVKCKRDKDALVTLIRNDMNYDSKRVISITSIINNSNIILINLDINQKRKISNIKYNCYSIDSFEPNVISYNESKNGTLSKFDKYFSQLIDETIDFDKKQ